VRLDAHQHFWHYVPEHYPWITDRLSALKRDYMPADLEPDLGALGFDGTIAVQARQDVGDTAFLLALADRHPLIKGVVGWVELCSPDGGRQLDEYAKHPALVGVRHVVHDEPDDDFMLRPDFRAESRACGLRSDHDLLLFPKHLYARSGLWTSSGSALRPRSHREAADARTPDVAMGRRCPPARRASQCRPVVGTRDRGPMGQRQPAASGPISTSSRPSHVAPDDRIRLACMHRSRQITVHRWPLIDYVSHRHPGAAESDIPEKTPPRSGVG
jgi:hypothetical protein